MAALARGESRLIRPLISSDALSCLEACRSLGASVERIILEDGTGEEWIITGTGGQITIPPEPIDVGNSGTTLYLAASLAALGGGR
jgi:3-phosphoshikimate 1-carboxyvinyltransferase